MRQLWQNILPEFPNSMVLSGFGVSSGLNKIFFTVEILSRVLNSPKFAGCKLPL